MRRLELGADAPDFYSLVTREVAAPEVELPSIDLQAVARAEALVPAIGTPANPWLTFPRFFHHRGGDCDKAFIEQRLKVIPPELLHAVCVSFEQIYLKGKGDRLSRFTAKTWLHKVASEYRQKLIGRRAA